MDIVRDPSLVLDLPLYKLDGGSIRSQDAYGRLFVVTGARWEKQGRLFDGSDDKIQHTVANFLSSNSQGTIGIWFKSSNTGNTDFLFGSSDTGGTVRYLALAINTSDKLVFDQRNNDTRDAVTGGTSVHDGKWHLVIVTSNGTSWAVSLNTIPETLTVINANSGDWFADTTLRDNVTFGARVRSGSNFFTGSIGEVWIYRRALTPLEGQRNYLATKWRYR